MLLRLGKFGVYCMGIVFLGGYLWSGGEDVQIRVQPSASTIVPPPNAVIPGLDGRDYRPPQGLGDQTAPISGVTPEEQPVLPPGQEQQPVTTPDRLDPVLSNQQVAVLGTCFEEHARRMTRINGDNAFRLAAAQGVRLLVQDGVELTNGPTAFACIDFANAVANNFGNLENGYCRTANITMRQFTPARTVSMQFCRAPETGALILGEQGVTLRRQPYP
jgi:hypothetical protein